MTSSGVYGFNPTVGDLILEAYEILQIASQGETLTGEQFRKGKNSLNFLLKKMQTDGIHLWTYTEGTLFLQVGQFEYDFGDVDTHLTNKFFETTLTAAASAGASTITVDDASDIQDTDEIGVIGSSDNNLFWTTVSGAPAGNVVTLTDVLPDSADNGAIVYNYRAATTTTPTLVPVSRLTPNGVRRRESTDYEIPIIFESRVSYTDLPNKQQLGQPIQAYYQRSIPFGKMSLWTAPNSSVPVINFTYERQLQRVVDAEETLDVSEEYMEAVVYNLARRLLPKSGASPDMIQLIMAESERSYDEALGYDDAVYPIEIDMDFYGQSTD